MATIATNIRSFPVDVAVNMGDMPEDELNEVQCDSVREDDTTVRNEIDLTQQLIDVDEEMGLDDLEGLRFLCRDHIPAGKLEKAQSALELFEFMKKSMMIDTHNVEFLLECLAHIHRYDLVKKLGVDVDKFKLGLPDLQKLLPFRILLMNLAEDLDWTEIEKIRFYLRGKIKKKQLNEKKSLLELFVFMEQEGVLAPNNLDLLMAIMDSIKRHDLTDLIREFRGEPRLLGYEAPVAHSNSAPASPVNALAIGSSACVFERPLTTSANAEKNIDAGKSIETIRRQGLHIVGSNQNVEQICNNRMPIRSISAGTLVISSQSSNDIEMEERVSGTIPEALFLQIANDLKLYVDDVATELGFAYEDIEKLKSMYPEPGCRTRMILEKWQADKTDMGSVASGLRYILQKFGCKTAVESLSNWMKAFDRMSDTEGAGRPRLDDNQPRGPPNENDRTNYHDEQPTQPANALVQNIVQLQEMHISGPFQSQQHIMPQLQNVRLIPNGFLKGSANVVFPSASNAQVLPEKPFVTPLTQVQQPVPITNINNSLRLNVDLPEYRMDRKPRGWCVIINNEVFRVIQGDNESKEMPARIGTNLDADQLQVVFKKLGFLIQRQDNLSDTDMMSYLIDISHNVDHSQFDCFVCCILTHGVLNHLYGSNGRLVSIKDLTATFQANRCPKLAGKPKLFFLQACQGRDKMSGGSLAEVEVDKPRSVGTSSLDIDSNEREMIPNEADFLIGYATVPGYVSFRSRNHGSWYIRKLCELLEKHAARHDLMSILVEVNREVAHADANLDGGRFKQIPAPLVTLRKRLYFR